MFKYIIATPPMCRSLCGVERDLEVAEHVRLECKREKEEVSEVSFHLLPEDKTRPKGIKYVEKSKK